MQYLLSRGYISPYLIKEMHYCPTIPWIIANIGYEIVPTPSIVEGISINANYKELIANKLNLPKPRYYEIYLESNRYGIAGVIDIVAGIRKIHIAEIKASNRTNYKHFKAQLMTYVLLVNDTIGAVYKAHLIMKNYVKTYQITEEDLKQVKKNVKKLWRIINNPEPPNTQQPLNKCRYCRYRPYCPMNN